MNEHNQILDMLQEVEFGLPSDNLKKIECSTITSVLHQNNLNRTHSAIQLGISRELLYHKMKKHNINV